MITLDTVLASFTLSLAVVSLFFAITRKVYKYRLRGDEVTRKQQLDRLYSKVNNATLLGDMSWKEYQYVMQQIEENKYQNYEMKEELYGLRLNFSSDQFEIFKDGEWTEIEKELIRVIAPPDCTGIMVATIKDKKKK